MSHHPNFQRATTLLLLLALSIICSATPTTSPSTRKRQAPPTPSLACGFAGNPDIYGIGIRLGLYAQWLSTYLSNWLHSAKVTDMRAINTFFQLAMFTALIAMANQTPSPQVIDPYIVIIQIMGSASTISKEATHKSQWAKTSWGGIIRFFLYFAVSLYAVWYWFRGLDTLVIDEAGCAPIGFAFSKVELGGWFRTANKVAAVIFAVVFTVLFGYSVYNFGPDYYNNGKAKIKAYRRTVVIAGAEDVLELGLNEVGDVLELGLNEVVNGSMKLPKWTPAACLLVLILSVTAVELVIQWNNVTDVNNIYSTGQLIPLVVGIGGLIQVLFKLKNQDARAEYLVPQPPAGPGEK